MNIQSKKFICSTCSYHTNKRSEYQNKLIQINIKNTYETKKSPNAICNKKFSSRTTFGGNKKQCIDSLFIDIIIIVTLMMLVPKISKY